MNIFDGKFAIRCKENTANAVKRTNKLGKEVHELHYESLSNVIITSITKVDNKDYGFGWEIGLSEADEQFILNLPYSGRQTNGLFRRLPNIDLKSPITLNSYKIEDDKKPDTYKTFLTVYQGGKKVDTYFTKENPNGLPQLEIIKVKGKDTWDDTKQMEFIEKMINTEIVPKLSAKVEQPKPMVEDFSSQEDDDLPF